MHSMSNDRMRHFPPMKKGHSNIPDLLWISKQQQQHPSTYAHPLKNTIRLDSKGNRHKFDGKQWRPLCQSPDGYECRNVAFRSSLCQKHFYKVNFFKRSYKKRQSLSLASAPQCSLSSIETEHETNDHHHGPSEDDDENDSIELIEGDDIEMIKEDDHPHQNPSDLKFFSIDCDSPSTPEAAVKCEPSLINRCPSRTDEFRNRFSSTNTESVVSNESECTIPRIAESIRLGLPPLTRTEEKSLAQELIKKFSSDVTLSTAEHWTRRRASEIIQDNYSQTLLVNQITPDWFYDFLLRNPRIPIHFQSWFSAVRSHLPTSDQLIDIKIWELGLITRSIHSNNSFIPTPPSSLSP